ncbi:hypothetical protein CPR19088_GLDEOEPO_00993 [Companilactobacillus paralimentarius]
MNKNLRKIRDDKKKVSWLAMFGIFLAFILLIF